MKVFNSDCVHETFSLLMLSTHEIRSPLLARTQKLFSFSPTLLLGWTWNEGMKQIRNPFFPFGRPLRVVPFLSLSTFCVRSGRPRRHRSGYYYVCLV